MELWKSLAAPLIVAIAGGLIVGLLLGRLQGPEIADITARANWISSPNPLREIPSQQLEEASKFLAKFQGTESIVSLLAYWRRDINFRLLAITFTNNSS